MGGFAWVTLATNDSYSLGALVLAHSLKQAGTTQQLAVLVTPGVTNAMREKLSQVFNLVQEVNILDSKDEANLKLLKRPELGITFTKLHCWRLTQYDKCVFLDADTLVLQNCDELFEREELSAAPDVGWPDCFNSGVFVYCPSNETYEKLVQFALDKGSFDGGDQGLLNLYFSDWAHKDISKHLPFIYNMCSTACYSYLPAFKQFGGNAKIIHFIGATKPWLQYFNTETRQVQPSSDSGHLRDVLQRWWDIFCSLIHPNLSAEMNRSGTDNVHTHGSPSQFPHNDPYKCQTSFSSTSADDYQNVWDPWDEYDQKQANIQTTAQLSTITHYEANQPIEPLNTNACSREGGQEHVDPHRQGGGYGYVQCIPYVESQPHSTSYEHPNPQRDHQEPVHSYHTEYSESPFHHHESHVNQAHHHPSYDQTVHNKQIYNEHIFIPIHQIQTDPPPSKPSRYIESDLHESPSHNEIHHHNEATPTISYHEPYHENSNAIPAYHSLPSLIDNTEISQPLTHPNLPKECKVTHTDSNDTSLYSCTNEDNSSKDDAGLAGAFAQLTLGVPRTVEQEALESHLRKQAWEVGNIDYLGRDSFENIWTKILDTLSKAPEPELLASELTTPTEQPKAPTEAAATQVKLPEPEPEAQQTSKPETPTEPKQPQIPTPVTPTAESLKPEVTPEQPASPVPQQTPTPEETKPQELPTQAAQEPSVQPQESPEQPVASVPPQTPTTEEPKPQELPALPAQASLAKPAQETPAQPAQEPPAQPAQEPPAQPAQEPPAQPAQEPPAQLAQEPPAQSAQEPPAQPAQEPSARPAQESPAQVSMPEPAPESYAAEKTLETKPETAPSPAISETPITKAKPTTEEVKSEPVTESLKVETPSVAPAEVKLETPQLATKTPKPDELKPTPEPVPVSKTEVSKLEPVAPESSDNAPKTTVRQAELPAETTKVPDAASTIPEQPTKVPEVVPALLPVSKAKVPSCKLPKETETPTKAPEPKIPEALTCPIKQSEPVAVPKSGAGAESKVTEATPLTTPPVEQAKEAVESADVQTTPPAEAGAVVQPQAPPRKVVKKCGTKKSK